MTFHPLGEIIKDDLGAEAHRLLRSKCDMGGYKAVGSVQDGGGGVQRRLLIKDINGSTGDHTVFKCCGEVFFHDNRAACNIDQKSRGLHHRKLFCVDHATGRVVQRAMQNHDVRAAEQFFLRDLLDVFCNAVMVRTALRQNSSTKCVKQLGSPGADLAKTDNTDRFALDLPADKTGRWSNRKHC